MENHIGPGGENSYRTGSTRPPKRRSGIIAFLLILTIVLAGAVSLLGMMNIRLFQTLANNGDLLVDKRPIPSASTTPSTGISSPQGELKLELADPPAAVDNIPQAGGLSLQEIYSRCIDSVVSIACQSGKKQSTGTGVVLSADGYIVTNAHVIDGASRIRVSLTDGRSFDAGIVGTDKLSDLAVLYVQATDLKPAQFGNSDFLRVGDAVCAIGDPLGEELRGTMTNGIVSAINRDITVDGRTMTLIQTNAALNPGNSGGPLINCHAQVVGINAMKIGDNLSAAGVEGLGFAIPSTTVASIVSQLMEQGFVSGRPALDFEGEDVSALYQHYYHLPAGVYVTAAGENAPLEEGDVITALNGIRIKGVEELEQALAGCAVGDKVTVSVFRNYQSEELTLTVVEAKK